MTISINLKCACGKAVRVELSEDEDIPTKATCESCKPKTHGAQISESQSFDFMNSPGQSEFPVWDPDGTGTFHGPPSEDS